MRDCSCIHCNRRFPATERYCSSCMLDNSNNQSNYFYEIVKRNSHQNISFAENSFDNEGLIWVQINEKWGVIDIDGDFTIRPIYDWIGPENEGLTFVIRNKKAGFVTKRGKEVIPLIYEPSFEPGFFSEGLLNVQKNGKVGFIDINQNVVIPFQFEAARGFTCGYAAIKQNGSWGYINKWGEIVIECKYEAATKFFKESGKLKARVSLWEEDRMPYSDKSHYINPRGKQV